MGFYRSPIVPQRVWGTRSENEEARIAASFLVFPVEPRGIEPLTSRVRFGDATRNRWGKRVARFPGIGSSTEIAGEWT